MTMCVVFGGLFSGFITWVVLLAVCDNVCCIRWMFQWFHNVGCFTDFAICVLLDWLVRMCILLALVDFITGYCLIGFRVCLSGLFQWFHIMDLLDFVNFWGL